MIRAILTFGALAGILAGCSETTSSAPPPSGAAPELGLWIDGQILAEGQDALSADGNPRLRLEPGAALNVASAEVAVYPLRDDGSPNLGITGRVARANLKNLGVEFRLCDGGLTWIEGQAQTRSQLSRLPKGRYLLRFVANKSAGAPSPSWVRRDVILSVSGGA